MQRTAARNTKGFMTAFGIALSVLGLPTVAGAEQSPAATAMTAANACPAIPKASWWHEDPQRIAATVTSQHGGNWDAYIGRWVRQKDLMVKVSEKGLKAVVSSRNLVLEGDHLKTYIRMLEARIVALECIATEAEAKMTDDQIAAFQTAAGSTGGAATGMCAAVPAVSWWTIRDHADMQILIQTRFRNDHEAYKAKLQAEMMRLVRSMDATGHAEVVAGKPMISGRVLADYIVQIANLIKVVDCLGQDRNMARTNSTATAG